MKSKSAFKLWETHEQQPRHIITSQSQNRLRKSLDNVKNLRLDLFKLRTSFSNASLSYSEFVSPLKKYCSTSLLTSKKHLPAKEALHSTLKDRLERISKKLKDAKREIQGLPEQNDAKTIRRAALSAEMVHSYETKESLLETERIKQKSLLAIYTAAARRPGNLRPISHNPYTLKSNKYYLGEVVRAINQKNSLAMQHINQSMQMLLQYKLFKINQQFLQEEQRIMLPFVEGYQTKKTLILDLDQTLIHCFQKNQCVPDIQLTIIIDGFPFEIGFNIRPYAISFLRKMKKNWEVIVFTASHQSYADTILNEIDPEGTLFDHRLYRQHCRELTTDLFVKDLSKINRDLSKVVLVDNSAYSYAMQLDNGIPILPFYQGKDFELTALQHYIQKLNDCHDVRTVNRQYFQLHRYTAFDNAFNLVKELYTSKLQ